MGHAGRAKLEGLNLGHQAMPRIMAKTKPRSSNSPSSRKPSCNNSAASSPPCSRSRKAAPSPFYCTSILNVSNLSNASAHTCENLPVILAGGGYQHQGHVVKDLKDNTPLSNLYVRMLQQTGIETREFGASEGVLGEVRFVRFWLPLRYPPLP